LAALAARAGDARGSAELASAAQATAADLHLAGWGDRAAQLLAESDRPDAEFRRHGEVWTLTFAGTTVQLADAKGLHDIAVLLAVPGQQITARQLAGDVEPDTGADEVLDAPARAAYKQRLADLDDEIDAADAAHDSGRAATFRAERDALVAALAEAYGLGGRPRRLGDRGERARTTVTARIRDTLRRIEKVHPALGRHLRESLATGRSCRYDPSTVVRWTL
jgi:hypothetical protein